MSFFRDGFRNKKKAPTTSCMHSPWSGIPACFSVSGKVARCLAIAGLRCAARSGWKTHRYGTSHCSQLVSISFYPEVRFFVFRLYWLKIVSRCSNAVLVFINSFLSNLPEVAKADHHQLLRQASVLSIYSSYHAGNPGEAVQETSTFFPDRLWYHRSLQG